MRLLRRPYSNRDFEDTATAMVTDVLLVTIIVAGAFLLVTLTAAAAEGRWLQVENKTNCAVWDPFPHSKATVTWSGICVNGKVQGRGRAVWQWKDDKSKESKYVGEVKDGKWHGRGFLVWASGSRYTGDFRDGKRTGRGVYVWADGRYEGDFRDGKFHGLGVQVGTNGDGYEGEWQNGKPHGHGLLVWSSGSRYEGSWKEGKRHGHGVYVAANGNRYEGEFRNNMQSGRGVAMFANGNECAGEFRDGGLLGTGNGRKNGQFKKCYLDGNTIKYMSAETSGRQSHQMSTAATP